MNLAVDGPRSMFCGEIGAKHLVSAMKSCLKQWIWLQKRNLWWCKWFCGFWNGKGRGKSTSGFFRIVNCLYGTLDFASSTSSQSKNVGAYIFIPELGTNFWFFCRSGAQSPLQTPFSCSFSELTSLLGGVTVCPSKPTPNKTSGR